MEQLPDAVPLALGVHVGHLHVRQAREVQVNLQEGEKCFFLFSKHIHSRFIVNSSSATLRLRDACKFSLKKNSILFVVQKKYIVQLYTVGTKLLKDVFKKNLNNVCTVVC